MSSFRFKPDTSSQTLSRVTNQSCCNDNSGSTSDKHLWLISLVGLTLVVSFVFIMFPAIDLAVSGWFAGSAGDFPWRQNQWLLAARDLNRTLPAILVPVLSLGLIIQALFNRRWLPAPHKLMYILSVYGVGAAAVGHSLKYLFGRARPSEIIEFGGQRDFSPAWHISHACHSSCSFPSGEAASAMVMLAIPLVLCGAFRWTCLGVVAFFTLIFSFNRIAMGAHFLSDVLLSWLFIGLTMAWLWPVFQRNAVNIDAKITKIGSKLRR